MRAALPWPRFESVAIALIALHSYTIGVFLLFFTEWGMRVGGWDRVEPLFFARQAGAFHLVVATGYLLEHLRHRGISLLIVAKSIAVLFLAIMIAAGNTSWTVWISLLGDAGMALVMMFLHRMAQPTRPPRGA